MTHDKVSLAKSESYSSILYGLNDQLSSVRYHILQPKTFPLKPDQDKLTLSKFNMASFIKIYLILRKFYWKLHKLRETY